MELQLAKVTLDSVNIYKDSQVGETVPVVGIIYKGTYIIIDETKTKNNMFFIYYGNISGYVQEKYIVLVQEDELKIPDVKNKVTTKSPAKDVSKVINKDTPKANTSEYLEVISPIGLWVHDEPNGNHIGILDYKSIVKVNSSKNTKGWYCIYFDNGYGYISDDSSYTTDLKGDDKIFIPYTNISYATVISPIGMEVFDKIPSDGGKVIGTLEFGTRVKVYDSNSTDSWICIDFGGIMTYTALHDNQWCYIQEEEITSASEALIEFTASYEGFRSEPYRGLDYQNETVGYGHVIKPWDHFTYPMTEEFARNLLRTDMGYAVSEVNKITEGYMLKQNQKDALYDFAYNCGVTALANSDLVQQAIALCQNNGYVKGDFTAWSYCNDAFAQGLYNRRYAEYKMFVLNAYDNN